jgi:hypothetical protein
MITSEKPFGWDTMKSFAAIMLQKLEWDDGEIGGNFDFSKNILLSLSLSRKSFRGFFGTCSRSCTLVVA